eukprot:TRINITY_DN1817_c0_g1_i9.p1 TRINITY_DN1817_c0_g1~~TRINITY_DN1817_c0_g1_i9.p1  ORF type:complete len:293 (-),score=51.87 TRINITY_DN1817_c0_g1_i9:220-1098(-)
MYADHMLEAYWNSRDGWGKPRIVPVHDFSLSPLNSGLNYGLAGIEGMKAYRDARGGVRTFRPDEYAVRLSRTSQELCLPAFDPGQLVECVDELLRVEERWVPDPPCALCIQPMVFSLTSRPALRPPQDAALILLLLPSSAHSKPLCTPVVLKAERNAFRSWPHQARCFRPGGTSALNLKYSRASVDAGFDQILWMHGKKITETDNSNIFVHLINDDHEEELVTPVCDGSALPGIYRELILEFARERKTLKVCEKDIELMKIESYSKRNKVLNNLTVDARDIPMWHRIGSRTS